ncbi:S9 family peptidase [Caulobacter sp. KR2-114]|uniref:S9 family peptidase n=1 Tax=Caulobacter sp. KR2-114 TaxID=3400912 RepID=UPI003C114381
MTTFSRGRLLALLMTAAAVGSPTLGLAQATAAPMTFEEVMRDQRRIEAVSFSPDGRRLIYSMTRNDRPSRGLGISFEQFQTYVADLSTGAISQIGGAGTLGIAPQMQGPWAPDGAGFLVMQASEGRQALGYVDVASGQVRTFWPAPAQLVGDWVGSRVVYITEEGARPSGWSRPASLAYLDHRWSLAWNADQPQVTVQSNNPLVPNPEPPRGGLVVADPSDGSAEIVARGEFASVKPSPDGRAFAVLSLKQGEPRALDTITGRRAELQVFRMTEHGARLAAAFPEVDAGQYAQAWSPDGGKLLVGARGADDRLGLYVVDMKTLALTAVAVPAEIGLAETGAGAIANFRQLGWVDGRPAFIGETAKVLAADADPHLDYGETRRSGLRLYVADGHGGVTALTDFAGQSITRFDEGGAGEAFVAVDGALWGVKPGRAPRRISAPDLSVVGLAEGENSFGGPFKPAIRHLGAGGDIIAVVARGPGGPRQEVALRSTDGQVMFETPSDGLVALSPSLAAAARLDEAGWSSILSVKGEAARTVVQANPEWAGRPLGERKHFTYEVGGRQLDGWVLLPPGQRGPAPAIVWIYGGQVMTTDVPRSAHPAEAVTPVFSAPLWAEQGYAVILPSTPTGRGATGDVADDLARDTVAAIDAAAAQGWVDATHVGIIGHSFGGYSTASVLSKRSDRFKAGIAMSGIYDPAAAWGARMPVDQLVDEDGHGFSLETFGYVEHGQEGLGVPPWQAVEAYVRNSPFYHAADIKAPLLLTVGDLDLGPTRLEQSERLYAALRRTGNPAVMIRYWGETHVQDDPWAVRDQWTRFNAWFAHYLR